jgi:hypothetical protein
MLLIEANMPGNFVATELQVRTRSAFANTRLNGKLLVYDSLSLPSAWSLTGQGRCHSRASAILSRFRGWRTKILSRNSATVSDLDFGTYKPFWTVIGPNSPIL